MSARYTGLIERYRDRLPVAPGTRIISLCEGNTPLIKLENIPKSHGRGCEIYVKFEGLNPTGSFKDRGMTMAVTQAVAEGAQAIGDLGLVQPRDVRGTGALEIGKPFGGHELHGTGALLAHVAQQREGVARRHLEAPPPALEHQFVVGQQSPQVAVDARVPVLGVGRRHRQREMQGILPTSPRLGVPEAQPSGGVALDPPGLDAGDQRDVVRSLGGGPVHDSVYVAHDRSSLFLSGRGVPAPAAPPRSAREPARLGNATFVQCESCGVSLRFASSHLRRITGHSAAAPGRISALNALDDPFAATSTRVMPRHTNASATAKPTRA